MSYKADKTKAEKLLKQTDEPVRNDRIYVPRINDEWRYCDQGIERLRPMWRANEKLFFSDDRGKLANAEAKSNVNDAHLATAIIQRTQRVMAQPPTGTVQAMDRNDRGKSMLHSILLDRYVKPNANAQFSHDTKLKVMTIYSQLYGYQPMLVDHRVTDWYIGPDFWLIPVDQYYPQPGVFQPNEMDYCFVDSFVSLEWIANRPTGEKYGWKNIDELISAIKSKEGKSKSGYDYQTYQETKWGGIDYGGKGRFSRILLRTKYMRDHWITYAPDYQDVGCIRDIANPHDNGRLPIVIKQTLPLLDRPAGYGDVERGASTQRAYNSLLNLYMDTVKYSLFPPMIVNRNGVVPSSMQWTPGAMWNETIPNSIRQLQLNPQGTNTFNNVAGFLASQMNNMLGASDLSIQKDVDPGLGKTPQAIKMQAAKESAADAWERDSIEEALEDIYDRFVDLMGKKIEKPIELQLFEGEIDNIAELYPDVTEYFESGSNGKITVKGDMVKGSYRFFIDSGTTMLRDTALENQTITAVMTMLLNTTNPQTGVSTMRESLQQKGKDIDMGELVKRWIMTSGISGADKIITDFVPTQPAPGMDPMMQGGQAMDPNTGQPMPPPDPAAEAQAQGGFADPDIAAVAQQLFGGGGGPIG